ncbi:MAG: energy transducer TonB [Gammaproteobacteria bacterium]|nr:energy transducer TonB [Gammaproteobacteria bacterium]
MQNKIFLFIALSALSHLSIIGLFAQQTNLFEKTEQGRSSFSVEITSTKNRITRQSKSGHTANSSRISDNKMQPDSLETLISVVEHSAMNNPVITATSHNNLISGNTSHILLPADSPTITYVDSKAPEAENTADFSREKIKSIIQTELSKYFYYPKSAQRKNWQGLVILSFIIMPDGLINHIKINQTSGYQTLDNAAINALEKINKQKEFSLALNGNQSHQLLPVNYKLTN